MEQKRNNFKQRLSSLLILFIFLLSPQIIKAQVTIGAPEKSADGALLQLKDVLNVSDGSLNAHKGLALPRVKLSDKNQLYPMFLADPNDSSSGPNTDYTANKATLDVTHTGLIVYNLTGNDDKELCVGLNQWDGEQWNCFEQKVSTAQFENLSCDGVKVYGTYIQGVEMTSSNYIALSLNVSRIGNYTITITTTNGYNFLTTGTILTTGDVTIIVPGQGTPIASGTNSITVSGITMSDTSCLPTITVSPPTATYTIDCGRITVNGTYKVGTDLTTSNTVTMYVTVTKATASAGNWSIKTNTIDGLYFSGSGTFAATGTYAITLYAYGTVESSKPKTFTMTTDSADGAATCTFSVKPVTPAKTLYTYGNSGTAYVLSNSYQANMLQSPTNFGPSGTYINEGFTSSNLLYRGSTANLISDLTSANPPDIIQIAYDLTINTDAASAIVDYAKKGGVVIMSSENGPYIQIMMNALFGVTNITSADGGPSNAVFALPTDANDPIIKGPFANLNGQYFAWDGGYNDYLKNIPQDQVYVYSSDNYVGSTTVTEGVVSSFRHKTLNFIFFADGGTFAGGSPYANSKIYYPVAVGDSPAYKPIGKTYTAGGTSTTVTVNNSYLICNILAWALDQAQSYGINSAKYK